MRIVPRGGRAHDQNAGKTRPIVGADSKGAPSISFSSENDDVRMALSLDAGSDSPQVRLLGKHGDPQISAGVDDRLGPGLLVGNRKGPRISPSADGQSPSVRFYDRNDNLRMKLSIAGNEPVIELSDQNRKIRSVWTVRKDGIPESALADPASKVRLQILSDANGKS